MNSAVYDLSSDAYYQPNYQGEFELSSTVLIYKNVYPGKIRFGLGGWSYILSRRFNVGSTNYAAVILGWSRPARVTIDSFRIGGYLPYAMKSDYSASLKFDPSTERWKRSDLDESLINQYLTELIRVETARIANQLIDGVNCIIVTSSDTNSMNQFLLTGMLADSTHILFASNEEHLQLYNRSVHRMVVFNFDLHHLSDGEIASLTSPTCRRYTYNQSLDNSVAFADNVKLIFVMSINSRTVFKDGLAHVGQKFRVIDINPKTPIEHEFVTIIA